MRDRSRFRITVSAWAFLSGAVILIMTSSCLSNKKLVYFQNQSFNSKTPTIISTTTATYKLQAGDVINVRFKTLDAESSDYFNILSTNGILNYNNQGLYINSYSVDEDGSIELPQIGVIRVGGLTVEETQKLIREKAKAFLQNATVLVKLVSFKISVLGEVENPGYYYVYNDRANILEGLALAGDLTDFGNRENITLLRQTGERSEAILINLKQSDILYSQY
jgi:polysaccharide export outer membrane protein